MSAGFNDAAFPHSAKLMVGEATEWGMPFGPYAAIKLRIPDSGIDWLDDMIRKAKRDELAGQALASMTVAPDYSKGHCNAEMAKRAYHIADAMLKEREEAK